MKLIRDFFEWTFHHIRYNYTIAKSPDGRYSVVRYDRRNHTLQNVSGRMLSKHNAEELLEELLSFKTYRDSKTKEGEDYNNPEVKAWLKRMKKR